MDGMDDSLVRALGQEIQSWRRLRKMSREQLALASGTSETTIGRIEREGPVDVAVTWRIADALGISLSDLVRRAEDMAELDPMTRARKAGPPKYGTRTAHEPTQVDWAMEIGPAAVAAIGERADVVIEHSDGSTTILEVKAGQAGEVALADLAAQLRHHIAVFGAERKTVRTQTEAERLDQKLMDLERERLEIERKISEMIARGTRRRSDYSAFDDADIAARDEDREKPRMD